MGRVEIEEYIQWDMRDGESNIGSARCECKIVAVDGAEHIDGGSGPHTHEQQTENNKNVVSNTKH